MGRVKDADVHAFRVSPERTSIKLEKNKNLFDFLCHLKAVKLEKNAILPRVLDIGKVSNFTAPNAKS